MTGEEFAKFILPRYRFRKDAADLVLDNCEFTLTDEMSNRGGGRVYFGKPCRVEFDSSQHEAAVHELAHAWYFLHLKDSPVQKEAFIDALRKEFLREADKTGGLFAKIRSLCHVYKYGDGLWAGMWIPPFGPYDGRWNMDEVFAGLASGSMGDVGLFPEETLRPLYEEMFQKPLITYLPFVGVYSGATPSTHAVGNSN